MALEQDLPAVTDTSTQGNNAKSLFIQLRIKMGARLMFAASAGGIEYALRDVTHAFVTSPCIAGRSLPLICFCHTSPVVHSRWVLTSWPALIITGSCASPVLSTSSWRDWMKMVAVA